MTVKSVFAVSSVALGVTCQSCEHLISNSAFLLSSDSQQFVERKHVSKISPNSIIFLALAAVDWRQFASRQICWDIFAFAGDSHSSRRPIRVGFSLLGVYLYHCNLCGAMFVTNLIFCVKIVLQLKNNVVVKIFFFFFFCSAF